MLDLILQIYVSHKTDISAMHQQAFLSFGFALGMSKKRHWQ